MNKSIIYPGSFDPMTFGHLDIIKRFHGHYDEFIVLISYAEGKNYMFSAEERLVLIKENVKDFKNVKVDMFSGLTTEYAKTKDITLLLRGLRGSVDLESETSLAEMNKALSSELETQFVLSSPSLNCISSRLIKEIAKNGGDISKFVPPNVMNSILSKYGNN